MPDGLILLRKSTDVTTGACGFVSLRRGSFQVGGLLEACSKKRRHSLRASGIGYRAVHLQQGSDQG